MSLQALLDSGRLKRHKTSAQEISKLFDVVKRDLADAQVKGLSEDRRFTIAYNAALQAGRALLSAEGYRTAGQGDLDISHDTVTLTEGTSMKKIAIESQIQFVMLREGDNFVAYAPALDMATSGKTFEEARKRSKELVEIFIEETLRHGTLDETLESLGWKKLPKSVQGRFPRWAPPQVVGQYSHTMNIPAGAHA